MDNSVFGISAVKLHNAIAKLEAKQTGKYAGTRGIHSVYSGLNQEIKRVVPGVDIASFWKAAVSGGIVEQRSARGGFMVYVAGTMPARLPSAGKANGLLSD